MSSEGLCGKLHKASFVWMNSTVGDLEDYLLEGQAFLDVDAGL